MKNKMAYLLIFLLSSSIYSQSLTNSLSQRNANYDISVKLDPDKKLLSGKQILTWKNITNTPTKELHFHLYLNAFRDIKSTFMQESWYKRETLKENSYDSLNLGWIKIKSMNLVDGEELLGKIEYIQPDDKNINDKTVFKVLLEKSVRPGETIQINFDFLSKLPNVIARTGFSDDFYFVGQWFPKIGVFEAAGQRGREIAGWNCHQFHSNSEFYADFGVYNVDITLPESFVVGATGVLINEIKNSDGTKTLKYNANDVVDFAWSASPLYVVVKDKWKGVEITVLLQPQHMSQASRHTESLINALEYFEENLGEFPYPQMTVVDPPFRGLDAAGMEYPMIITAGCMWGIPDGLRYTEMVTIHEFGHNYFMGILASNEFEEAWLDEGMNSYFENKIMDHYYGNKTSMMDFLGYQVGDLEESRISYVELSNPYKAEINRYSWLYKEGGYGVMSYSKASVVLQTLENIIGSEVMTDIMKTYYEQWKFKHPGTQDFINIVNEKVSHYHKDRFGQNMNWFFDQLIEGVNTCDYKVQDFWSYEKHEETDNTTTLDTNEVTDEKVIYKSKIIIVREGEVVMPQEILIHFEDGEEILENWDGEEKSKLFTYEGKSEVDWVKVDPENKILIDVNLANNSLTSDCETGVVWKYASKMMFWVQNTMLSMFF